MSMFRSQLHPASQQPQQTPIQQLISPSQLVLFSRLNNYLLFHFVPLVQFWHSQRLCVTVDQFQKMLENIRFYKGKDEIREMRQNKVQFIALDQLLAGVNQWKKSQTNISSFLQKQKQYLHQLQSSPDQQQLNKKRAKSNIQAGILDLNSYTELKSQLKSQRNNQQQSIKGNNSRITNRTKQSNSQFYLAENSKKKHNALLQLNSALIRTKNQSHYELAIKVGQLNDICRKLKNSLTYLILTKEDGQIQIIEKSSKNDSSKVLSQKSFEKRYEELKTLSNNIVDEIEGTLEKDLRQTLVQVMYLSDQLKSQIALLKRKGVNA